LPTFDYLVIFIRSGHHCVMTDTPTNSDYLVGRFFVGLLASCAVALLLGIGWEIHTGIAHKKFGVDLRETDPSGFWIEIAFQAIFAAGFAWGSFHLRKFARKPMRNR